MRPEAGLFATTTMGIATILEFDSPFSGLIRVSAEPMLQALTQIMQ